MSNKLIGVDVASGRDEMVKTLVVVDEAEGVPEINFELFCGDILYVQPTPIQLDFYYYKFLDKEDSDTPIIVEEKK